MYLDTAYVAKAYLQEPDSRAVHELVSRTSETRYSSVWAITELHCVVHRRLREGTISQAKGRSILADFSADQKAGIWTLVPVHEALLRRTSALVMSLPATVFIRAADALHLTTAMDIGEKEIWTNDRHMLAAAPHFGLLGRSVRA